MARVYLSYATNDRGVAQSVIEAIRQTGFDVSSPYDNGAGQALQDPTRDQIAKAECVVALWSNAAMQSNWVQNELRQVIAAWSTDRLVLAALDDTPFPVGLRDLSAIAIKPGSDSTKQLIQGIQAILGRQLVRETTSPTDQGNRPVRRGPIQQPPSNGRPWVFISYSDKDSQIVDQVANEIRQLGHTVWMYSQETGPQRFAARIVQAIRQSKQVALMCSQHAFASDHVIREVYVAGDFKKPFIIFQLDPAEFPDELLYFISGFPRVLVSPIDAQQLRSQIANLIAV